ncbi:MAG: VCBS repeat-containing protein [Proteobacteria bacterium]|nr:VCBS repeat-containing protein [Pseudomonadota bacterium]
MALAAGGCSAPGEDVDGTVGLATELIFQDDGGQMIRAVATADWDGDGDLDGAAVGDPGVRLYSAEGGGFSLTAEASAPDLPWSLAFADVDSDGALDLILGLSSGRLIARDPSDGTLDGTYTELAQVADQGSVRSMSWSTPGGRPCPITPSGPSVGATTTGTACPTWPSAATTACGSSVSLRPASFRSIRRWTRARTTVSTGSTGPTATATAPTSRQSPMVLTARSSTPAATTSPRRQAPGRWRGPTSTATADWSSVSAASSEPG